MLRLLAAALPTAFALSAFASTIEISPSDDLRAAIAGLKPGDELVLAGGTYIFSARFNINVVGLPDRPVIIRSQAGEDVLIQMDTESQNILEIQASRYLILRDLRFRGGSHGIRLMDSDFITIEDCEVFETGDVAISANAGGTYEGLLIRRNHIHHTNGSGEAVYFGCSSDGCRVKNSVIEWNYIHHTNRTSVSQGDGIELKEGSSGNIVRHNVIHDTNYPGIITFGTVGNGPPNILEGNLIWNTNDNAIQSAADSIIRNNIVLGSPIVLQAHDAGSPSNQIVVHNTIISAGDGIKVQDITGPVVVANNAVYSNSGRAIRLIGSNRALVTVSGNVGRGGLTGASSGFTRGSDIAIDLVGGHFDGEPPIDLFPSGVSALAAAGDVTHVASVDFNGTPRRGQADVGAYRSASGDNPGWRLAPAFKLEAGAPLGTALPTNPSGE